MWSQIIYITLLLIASGVAWYYGNRFIILIMWINLAATMLLNSHPILVGAVDLISASVLLMVIQGKVALTIAAIFCIMALIYPLSLVIGNAATYTIVDILAYVQLYAMGSDGFCNFVRNIRHRHRLVVHPIRDLQSNESNAKKNHQMAMGKDTGH